MTFSILRFWRFKVMNEKHIAASLDKIRKIFEKASSRIEALKPGEKIPATVLADQIAKEENMNGPQLYPTLLFLIKNYPGPFKIKKGAQGGIYRLLDSELKLSETSDLEIKETESKS
jgi:hypothetical protein